LKKLVFILIIALVSITFAGCSNKNISNYVDRDEIGYCGSSPYLPYFERGEVYNRITESPFLNVEDNAKSNISLNANTASYSIIRNAILNHRQVDKDSVRTEEMINYFSYSSYEEPTEGLPIKLNYGLLDCPWNDENKLLTIGLKTKDIEFEDTENNLVFLIDVSGSMKGTNRLDLLQEAFLLLINNLKENDTVSIVTYSGNTKVVIEGESNKDNLATAINELTSGGSTDGSSGINLAYETALKYFKEDGNNRIILATDGDFNVGTTSIDDLKTLIKDKANQQNIYLSVIGVGAGNLNDSTMETLANNGNGNYAYLDNLNEAQKVMVDQLNGTMLTVAKDTKAQIEFTSKVLKYRIIGFENHMLSNLEYEDSTTDAGEIGSGLSVTAVYEIVLSDDVTSDDKLAVANVKYKTPDSEESELLEISIDVNLTEMELDRAEDVKFISAVVEFSLILRNSYYKSNSKTSNVIERLESLDLTEDKSKQEFLTLVQMYENNY